MTDDKNDPLARVLGELPRLAPGEARSARIRGRCAALYDAPRETERPTPGRGTLLVGFLSVVYLVELTWFAARLSFWKP